MAARGWLSERVRVLPACRGRGPGLAIPCLARRAAHHGRWASRVNLARSRRRARGGGYGVLRRWTKWRHGRRDPRVGGEARYRRGCMAQDPVIGLG